MIFCPALNKSFATKELMFKELRERKDEIFALKKATIKTTDGCGFVPRGSVSKTEAGKQLAIGDTVSNVINTTNYLDSHDDVHMPNIWDKSIVDQKGKIYHAVDHELKVGQVVAYPEEVEMELKAMSWRDLGLDVEGITMALIFNSLMTDKTNPDAFKAYRDKAPVQHSIRMRYVNIKLAINDPDMKEEYATYQACLPFIINRDKAEQQGYFFPVYEAKIEREGSTVLFGSNDITPSLGVKDDTQKQPEQSTVTKPTFKEMLDGVSFFKQ